MCWRIKLGLTHSQQRRATINISRTCRVSIVALSPVSREEETLCALNLYHSRHKTLRLQFNVCYIHNAHVYGIIYMSDSPRLYANVCVRFSYRVVSASLGGMVGGVATDECVVFNAQSERAARGWWLVLIMQHDEGPPPDVVDVPSVAGSVSMERGKYLIVFLDYLSLSRYNCDGGLPTQRQTKTTTTINVTEFLMINVWNRSHDMSKNDDAAAAKTLGQTLGRRERL